MCLNDHTVQSSNYYPTSQKYPTFKNVVALACAHSHANPQVADMVVPYFPLCALAQIHSIPPKPKVSNLNLSVNLFVSAIAASRASGATVQTHFVSLGVFLGLKISDIQTTWALLGRDEDSVVVDNFENLLQHHQVDPIREEGDDVPWCREQT